MESGSETGLNCTLGHEDDLLQISGNTLGGSNNNNNNNTKGSGRLLAHRLGQTPSELDIESCSDDLSQVSEDALCHETVFSPC